MVNFSSKYAYGKALMLLVSGNIGVAYCGSFSIFTPWCPAMSIIGIVWAALLIHKSIRQGSRAVVYFALVILTLANLAYWLMSFCGWAYDPEFVK